MHKIWAGVRNIILLESKKSHSPISISVDTGVTSDPVIVANNFNDFYSSIADKVRSEIPDTNYHFSNFLKIRNRNSIFLSPTNPEEVLKVVDSFFETKSACLLYTSPSPRDGLLSRMPSSA